MALWGKKKITDYAEKFLHDNNVTIEKNDGIISFELYLKHSEYSVFPYLKIDEDKEEMSIVINLREVTKEDNIYFRINEFNRESKLFTAKLSEDKVLYLEYNLSTDAGSVRDDLKYIIENVLQQQELIDKL